MSYTLAYQGAEIDDILGRAAPGGAIDTAIAAKQDVLTFDAVPTEGSTNPAESGGIYDAIQAGGETALAAFATDSVSGDIVSFPDGADGIPVKAFTGSIVPQQSGSGDPAPDNVRPISGWTGAKIWRSARNLVCGRISGYTINASGILSPAQGGTYDIVYAKVEQGEQYIVTSGSGLVGGFFREVPAASAQSYNQSRLDTGTLTVTAPIDGWLAFRVATGYETPQVDVGSTATAYDDTLDTILLDFGQTVYAGTLTALGGGLWKIQPTHAYRSITSADVFAKSANAQIQTGRAGYYLTTSNQWLSTVQKSGGDGNPNGVSILSDVVYIGDTSAYDVIPSQAFAVGIGVASGNTNLWFNVDATTCPDVASFKTYLDSLGMHICYPLATLPDPITITGEDLQTLLGANTVWTDVGAVTGMTYRADTALYIQKLIGGGGTLQTLSMASPSPSLSLDRVGVLAEPEVSEPEQTDEEAEQLEQTEEPEQTEEE